MKNKIFFFGLLHIKSNENRNLNFNSINDKQKLLVYLKNAILLDTQLKFYGYHLTVITNNKTYLNRLLKKLNYNLKLKSIKFTTFVPKNTHFYSCHFRVDTFRYLSRLKNVYSVLLDLDILILNNPNRFINLQKKNISLVNNISQNVIPAYGRKQILKNLKVLNPNINKVLWFGGDFFAGNNIFFKNLHNETKFFQRIFVQNIKKLYNQTDELFVSASLYNLKNKKNLNIKYANNLNIFTRYWNTNILHDQKEISFYKKFIFLHTPADKIFLSNCYEKIKYQKNFQLNYFNYVLSIKNNLKIKLSKILPKIFKEKIKNFFFN